MFETLEDLAHQYYEKGHPASKDIKVEVKFMKTIERRPKKQDKGQVDIQSMLQLLEITRKNVLEVKDKRVKTLFFMF